MTVERFGIVSHRHPIVFNGGAITPLDDIADVLAHVTATLHPDGFIYPPTQHTIIRRFGREGVSEEVQPHSERPALLFPLPVSHTISVDSPIERDFKRGDGGFLIHLAAYLFGTRVQFEDWDIDGRIPFKHPTHAVHVRPSSASAFFSTAYDTWRAWPAKTRRGFTTALYVHSKAPGYEWLWETFLMEYMTFDTLWRLSGLPRTPCRANLTGVRSAFTDAGPRHNQVDC